MTPGTPHFNSGNAILTALKTAVEAVQLPGDLSGGGNALQSVKIFDSENLADAFQYLLITEQRVCVIVPLNASWSEETKNTKLIVRRIFPVALLISDRVFGNRQTALLGDDSTPGALALKDLVLPAITGQLIPNPAGVICAPQQESVLTVSDTEKKLPNRITVLIEAVCRGGWIEAQTSPVI